MICSSRFILPVLLAFWLGAAPSRAQGLRSLTGNVDYAAVSREIRGFEAVVNKALSAAFTGAPFAVYQQTKGVYLQGYGATFCFTINLPRALVTPFGVVPGDDTTPEQKRRRIEDLKDRLSRVLLESGANLKQLRKEDTITIVGFFDDRNFPEEPSQNKTVILSVLKKDLDDVVRAEDRWKEFKQRMKSVEY